MWLGMGSRQVVQETMACPLGHQQGRGVGGAGAGGEAEAGEEELGSMGLPGGSESGGEARARRMKSHRPATRRRKRRNSSSSSSIKVVEVSLQRRGMQRLRQQMMPWRLMAERRPAHLPLILGMQRLHQSPKMISRSRLPLAMLPLLKAQE